MLCRLEDAVELPSEAKPIACHPDRHSFLPDFAMLSMLSLGHRDLPALPRSSRPCYILGFLHHYNDMISLVNKA